MPGLIVGIRYLAGYAAAADPTDRQRAEWPPHPARVFMALAAAHFETGQNPDERAALEWLQAQGSPDVVASEAQERTAVTAYVPINDDPVGKSRGPLQCIPAWPRSKQPRCFPRVRPDRDVVYLGWQDACPSDEHGLALGRLCSKVVRIGHSSSLVQMWVAPGLPNDTQLQRWQASDLAAEVHLRVPTDGLLSRLKTDYDAQHRPRISTWQGYARAGKPEVERPEGTIWDTRLLVRCLQPEDSPYSRLGLVSTLQVSQAMHEAVLSQANGALPEFVSGHLADGSPAQRPHVAYFPLSFVGSGHATGQLMGMGVALPADLSRAERTQALAAVGKVDRLTLGPLGTWGLTEDDLAKTNLRAELWTAHPDGSRQWATVAPLAFDRHTKTKDPIARQDELAEMVRQCCQRIGLPEPVHVVITPVSPHLGTPAAHEFPRLQRKDGSRRRHAHAILVFAEPVRGPIALGAGRYRGYGLCRPLRAEEAMR